ncbi:glutathione S-transferase family protein [Inquilinus sp. Marseille-Q2685]|uniref:glutathione S-transferase family protein n=1 Tax=Inquilinus sp. Marseille-Q2685 TaxID=2866581 RepID=UPI001CE487F7|nr:glutathione S-transferase family protein [Inquilinus sp. Marseille-Q2685]
MYTLYATPGTGSTLSEIMLTLAGVPFAIKSVDVFDSPADREMLQRLNPLTQVPVLVLPDGTVMTESGAITLHLADVAPDAGLAPPAGHPDRPAFLRRLVFIVAALYPTWAYGDDPGRWVTGDQAKAELRASTDEHRKVLWRQMEAAAGAPWFLGGTRTAIDIYVAVMNRWRPRSEWFAAECPKLSAIAGRLRADPALAEVWQRNEG